MKVPVLVLLLSACSSLALAWQTDAGSGWPYYYGEESFEEWAQSPQGRFRVLERFTHELLVDAVGKYRVAELEAAPRSFLQPKYYDADSVAYVKGGEAVIIAQRHRHGRRRRRPEDFVCVREGDLMIIPAGSVVYGANTHSSEWLRAVKLLNPVVSMSGRFQEYYFPLGGGNAESFLGVFSDDVIQASFNITMEEWEKVFGKQSEEEITMAYEERIRELNRSCSRLGRKSEIKLSSLTGKKPTYSNSHGKHHEITGDELPHLRVLDMKVGLTNITRGSMMALSYNTRAHRIVFVVDGKGYIEMATGRGQEEDEGQEAEEQGVGGGGGQHKSRSYRQVKSPLGNGSVFVVPAGHPTVLVAGKDVNLVVLSFDVNASLDEKVFLAGTNSVLKQLGAAAKEIAFGGDKEEVERIVGAQKQDAFFLRGP